MEISFGANFDVKSVTMIAKIGRFGVELTSGKNYFVVTYSTCTFYKVYSNRSFLMSLSNNWHNFKIFHLSPCCFPLHLSFSLSIASCLWPDNKVLVPLPWITNIVFSITLLLFKLRFSVVLLFYHLNLIQGTILAHGIRNKSHGIFSNHSHDLLKKSLKPLCKIFSDFMFHLLADTDLVQSTHEKSFSIKFLTKIQG